MSADGVDCQFLFFLLICFGMLFQDFMPLPPDGDANDGSEPRLDFSHVECLIYSYHRLGRQCPDALTKDPEKLKDFRLR